jgi:hypothetical protein
MSDCTVPDAILFCQAGKDANLRVLIRRRNRFATTPHPPILSFRFSGSMSRGAVGDGFVRSGSSFWTAGGL